MRILYVFPHPDDESFGPAPAIAAQRRRGDEVYLLTLTRGEATKQRFRLDLTKEEMGDVRYREMQCVERVLDLSGLTVLNLPDDGLKEMNPIRLEEEIREHVLRLRPDLLVTYAVHGVSGFEDHLVTHAVVKRVYCELRERGEEKPARLALFTWFSEEESKGKFDLTSSAKEEIDCFVECGEEDYNAFLEALECYETYQEVIRESGVREEVGRRVAYEFFQENYDPPADNLGYGL